MGRSNEMMLTPDFVEKNQQRTSFNMMCASPNKHRSRHIIIDIMHGAVCPVGETSGGENNTILCFTI